MGFGYGPWGLSFWEIIILVMVFSMFFKPRDSKKVDKLFDDFSRRQHKEKEAYEEVLDAYEEALDACEINIEKLEARTRVLERIVTDTHQSASLSEEIDNLKQ